MDYGPLSAASSPTSSFGCGDIITSVSVSSCSHMLPSSVSTQLIITKDPLICVKFMTFHFGWSAEPAHQTLHFPAHPFLLSLVVSQDTSLPIPLKFSCVLTFRCQILFLLHREIQNGEEKVPQAPPISHSAAQVCTGVTLLTFVGSHISALLLCSRPVSSSPSTL